MCLRGRSAGIASQAHILTCHYYLAVADPFVSPAATPDAAAAVATTDLIARKGVYYKH